MKKQIEQVKEFYEAFKVSYSDEITLIPRDRAKLRFELMKEENQEFKTAFWDNDIVEVADAAADQLYILLGTVIEYGLQDKFEALFDEVHRSNMSKLDKDGKPILRGDGKIIKSELYEGPHVENVLFKKD